MISINSLQFQVEGSFPASSSSSSSSSKLNTKVITVRFQVPLKSRGDARSALVILAKEGAHALNIPIKFDNEPNASSLHSHSHSHGDHQFKIRSVPPNGVNIVWFVIIVSLLISATALAFMEQPPSYLAPAPLKSLANTLFKTRQELKNVMWGALFVHVLEGLFALVMTLRWGFLWHHSLLWALQSFVIGFPSLIRLRAVFNHAKEGRKID